MEENGSLDGLHIAPRDDGVAVSNSRSITKADLDKALLAIDVFPHARFCCGFSKGWFPRSAAANVPLVANLAKLEKGMIENTLRQAAGPYLRSNWQRCRFGSSAADTRIKDKELAINRHGSHALRP